MTSYVALLRAVNVGGTGKLPMSQLRAICEACCFTNVRTYIASRNAVFDAQIEPASVKADLERAPRAYMGKPVGVIVRTGAEMAAVLTNNPFRSEANRTVAIFLDGPPPADLLESLSGRGSEEIAPGAREIYVHYRDGMGSSKLRIRAADSGTARNMSTVAKLGEWASTSSGGPKLARVQTGGRHGRHHIQ